MKRLVLLAVLACPALPGQTPLGITHGPMVGRPGATQMAVWARTERPAAFRVRYGTDPGRLTEWTARVETKPADDNTAWVLLQRLQPDTVYYYQVVPEGRENAPVRPDGRFRTLPAPEQFRNAKHNPRGLFNFAFEFACGNNQRGRPGPDPTIPTYRTMLDRIADRVHFAILNGDWLYETDRDYPREEWLEQVGLEPSRMPRIVSLAPSITGVWENYKTYLRRGRKLSEWHRRVPSLFTFDDHEILNDVYGIGTPGRRDRKAVFRDIALSAWYDYLGWSNPVPWEQDVHIGEASLEAGSGVLADPQADFTKLDLDEAANLLVHWGGQLAGILRGDAGPGDPNAGTYQIVEVLDAHRLRIHPPARSTGRAVYSIGRLNHFDFRLGNAHLFFLDTRSHRQMHDTSRPGKPGLSMLGRKQKKWLMEAMKASDADFFFVVSSVNFMIPHVGATPSGAGRVRPIANKDDAWTVFLEEREQLIRFWDSLGKPVMVLTGDLHNSFAIQITDRVWEFASGPHLSRNHNAASEGGRPPNGEFDSGGRKCRIAWSTYFLPDTPAQLTSQPVYTVVQVNNVFNNPAGPGEDRWVAFPVPQVVVRFHDGRTGELLYAQPVAARP